LTPQSLHLTQQVVSEREELETVLASLGPQIKLVLNRADTLRQECAMLSNLDDQMMDAKDFTYKVKVDKFRKHPTPAGQHTTTCTICDWTCHKNCAFENDGDKKLCSAMRKDGNCGACPKHCHWSSHQNLPYILEWYQETQTKTINDLKERYTNAKSSAEAKEQILEGLITELDRSRELVVQMVVQMNKCHTRLSEIAMKPNAMPSDKYVQLMIDAENSNQKVGYQARVRALEEVKKNTELMKDVTAGSFDPLKEFKADADLKKQLNNKKYKKLRRHRGGFFSNFWH